VSPGETQNAQACAVVDTPPDSGVEDRPRFKSSQGAYHKIPYRTRYHTVPWNAAPNQAKPYIPSRAPFNTLLKRATGTVFQIRIGIQHFGSMRIRIRILFRIQIQGFDDQMLTKLTAEPQNAIYWSPGLCKGRLKLQEKPSTLKSEHPPLFKENLFFVSILKARDKKSRIRIRIHWLRVTKT
jgi:hypothetical protein